MRDRIARRDRRYRYDWTGPVSLAAVALKTNLGPAAGRRALSLLCAPWDRERAVFAHTRSFRSLSSSTPPLTPRYFFLFFLTIFGTFRRRKIHKSPAAVKPRRPTIVSQTSRSVFGFFVLLLFASQFYSLRSLPRRRS